MANATFYKLSKRHNSTLQPSGSGTVIDVQKRERYNRSCFSFKLNISSGFFHDGV